MRLRKGIPSMLAAAAALLPAAARASFLPPEVMDTVAMVLAWVVIVVAPIIAIGVFLAVHVIPEKIAEKNHHPQQDAIKTLCFLSLVFGGMLWPLAWLWAYTRPVGYRTVYGTEKHEHYFVEMGEKAARGELDALELDAPARRGRGDVRARSRCRRRYAGCRRSWRRPGRKRRSGSARRGAAARARRGPVMELILLGIYAAFVWLIFIKLKWLPWNIGLAGDRGDHPDRGADGAHPHAQRRGAVVGRRARHQVRGEHRAAGEGPGDRGSGRTQPAGEEGRRAVQDRPHALPAPGERARSAARQRHRLLEGTRGAAHRFGGAGGPGQERHRAGGRAGPRSVGEGRSRAYARRTRTANWWRQGPATSSTWSRRRRTSRNWKARLDGARSAEAQARSAEAQALAGERQIRQRLGAKANGEYAQVAQVRAQLESAKWDLSQTTATAPANGYAINVQLRPGSMTAAFPALPVMTFVEDELQVIALYSQNELTRSSRATKRRSRWKPIRAGSSRRRSIPSSGRRARARRPRARRCRRPARCPSTRTGSR